MIVYCDCGSGACFQVALRGRLWTSGVERRARTFLGAVAPTVQVAEVTIEMIYCELVAEPTTLRRVAGNGFSDCHSALNLVPCGQSAHGNGQLLARCPRPYSGGNEVEYAGFAGAPDRGCHLVAICGVLGPLQATEPAEEEQSKFGSLLPMCLLGVGVLDASLRHLDFEKVVDEAKATFVGVREASRALANSLERLCGPQADYILKARKENVRTADADAPVGSVVTSTFGGCEPQEQ